MTQQSYTNEQLSKAFKSYLLKHLDGDADEVDVIIETIELIMPNTLHDYFGTQLKSIYEITDAGEVDSYLRKMQSDTMLKNIDRSEENRYSNSMKWYRRFIKALNANATPVPVQGEEDQDYPNQVSEGHGLYGGKVAHNDNDYAPDTEGTEHQFNLTKKERNPELRRKCIEYYKNEVMGGRIYCLCCGFDFGKVYGDIGEDYIEIHHTEPHFSIEGEHFVDPKTKLIPLCSNCHSMIHRVPGRGTCMTLEELKAKLKR